MTAVFIFVGPFVGIIFVSREIEEALYSASLYDGIILTITLVIFGVALCRINRTVKGIEEAFPNRGVTILHFTLIIMILVFTIIILLGAIL